MKYGDVQRDGSQFRFSARDQTTGYAVLGLMLLVLGGSMVWWWPGPTVELVAPWTRADWGGLEALGYGMLVAIAGGLVVVVGGYVSEYGRRHNISFDRAPRRATVEEWWRRLNIDLEVPLHYFSSFEIHRAVDRDDIWQLGAVLDNGSYWSLNRDSQREKLEELVEELDDTLDFDGGERPAIDIPQRIEVETDDGQRIFRWEARVRPVTRGLMLVATLLFSLAALLPVVLVFDGAIGLLLAALAVGAVLFGIPLYRSDISRVDGLFFVGWLAVVVAAVVGLNAHWAYFVLATVGVGVFGTSCVAVASGFLEADVHSLRIDDGGRFYDDGELVEADDTVVIADELEGAMVNVTDVRPPVMLLVEPGQAEESRSRHLGLEDDPDAGYRPPVELELEGLSVFELVGLSLVIDDWIGER